MKFFCEDASQCKLEEMLQCIMKFVDHLSTCAQVSGVVISNDGEACMHVYRMRMLIILLRVTIHRVYEFDYNNYL